ncbi:MAG: excinuclease ABC subunit UvrC [Spirochaetales bacterium]
MNDLIVDKLKKLPQKSGVYIMKNAGGTVIYVGKAKVLKNRVSSYFVGIKKDVKTLSLVSNIADFEYIVTPSEYDALILENNLIKKYKPHYNILLKDSKTYPYIKITMQDDFPKIEVVRKIKNDGAKYFGPYFAGVSPSMLIEMINYAYPIRTCNLNLNDGKRVKRECLNYALGLCSAPCTSRISKEDYLLHINEVIDFLKGKTSDLEAILTLKMQNAAKMQKYETAIRMREQLKALDRLKEQYTTQFTNFIDMDIIGYFDNGISVAIAVLIIRDGKMLGCDTFNVVQNEEGRAENISAFISQYYSKNIVIPQEIVVEDNFEKETLENWLSTLRTKKVQIMSAQKGTKHKLLNLANENAKEYLIRSTESLKLKEERTIGALNILKDKLELKTLPHRIECYDISNISGTDKVASMVVFIDGVKDVGHYRKFKIKTVEGSNDFASMEETLKRRFMRLTDKDISFSSMPDLILIDGGKGQLSSAKKAIESVGYFRTDLISIAKREEEIFKEGISTPFIFTRSNYGLQLLQRLRDEAHRFAITFHRSLRDKHIKSVLDDIEGVGAKRKVALLKHFKNIKNIAKASAEELQAVGGISQNIAVKIQQFFADKEV